MRLSNSSRLAGDTGSAVVEFVLVIVPFVLLCAGQLGWLADSIERTQLRQIAIDAARYAALADVTQAQANAQLIKRLETYRTTSSTITFGTEMVVRISFASHQPFALGSSRLVVTAFAKREID